MQENPEKLYHRYVELIRDGVTSFEPYARELAKKYGFSTEKLEKALSEGRRKSRVL
jgi:DNA-binding phage protein